MNVTRDIAKLLGTDEATAETVRDLMGDEGIDFSQCSRREFSRYAFRAFDTLQAVRVDMGKVS